MYSMCKQSTQPKGSRCYCTRLFNSHENGSHWILRMNWFESGSGFTAGIFAIFIRDGYFVEFFHII